MREKMKRVQSLATAGISLGVCVLLAAGHTRPDAAQPNVALPNSGTAAVAIASGQIFGDNGTPAAGVSVVAWSTHYVSAAPAAEAVTDATGRYKITVDTGRSPRLFQNDPTAPPDTEFRVTVEDQQPLFLVPPSRTVTLTPGVPRPALNFRLLTGPQVTLRVRDALTGQPVPGILARYQTNQPYSSSAVTAAVTDAQGQARFRVPSLFAGLSLVSPGGTQPAVQAAPGYAFYREINEQHLQDVVWNVKTYPADLPKTPTVWRGIVLSADGKPASGAQVSVLRPNSEVLLTTDDKGRFAASLPPLLPSEYSGAYRAVAILAQNAAHNAEQYAVEVPTSEAIWNGIRVQLSRQPLACYKGVVVGEDGQTKAGVAVSCRGGLAAAGGAGLSRATVTDAAGRFTLSGLPAGRYQVNLGGGSYGLVTFPPSDPGYPYSKTILTLGDGEQHDFGRLTVLPADQVVSGQIVDAAGKPVSEGITVIIHGAHTSQTATLDSQGRFRVSHVVREPLTLDLYQEEANHFTRLGQDSPDLFRKVPVEAGQEDVRVRLPVGIPAPPHRAL